MKKFLIAFGGVVALATAALCLMAARYEAVIRPNVKIGPLDVGGLTPTEAGKKLREWWETERTRPISLSHPKLSKQPDATNLTGLGLDLDDAASVSQLPLEYFWDSVQRNVGISDAPPKSFAPAFSHDPARLTPLANFVRANGGKPSPAKVKFDWKTGQIQRTPERTVMSLETSKVRDLALEAQAQGSSELVLPLAEAPKKMSDDMLAKMSTVMTSFSTRFPTSKVTRCANIKLASEKIDGTILMPGEDFRFNKVVGRRTIAAGFKVAGVFKNGKHDTDVGGGICQVSTTLYNAAVRSDMKIKSRSNHSLPITYVPLGTDATVDYDSHDLVFTNTLDHPVAIFALYEPGKLTFNIVGQKLPYTIKLEPQRLKAWSVGTKYVHDGTLPPGKQKVIEKGGGGSSYVTYKVYVQNDKVIKREKLNESFYRGGPRIVAVNQNPIAPASPAPTVVTPPTKPVSSPPPAPAPAPAGTQP